MRKFLALVLLSLAALPALAQLSIEITGAGANRIPIAIAAFAGEAALPPGITAIVRADLERSGLFRALELPGGYLTAVTSFVTYMVVHAGWVHLVVNLLWMLAFGSAVAPASCITASIPISSDALAPEHM